MLCEAVTRSCRSLSVAELRSGRGEMVPCETLAYVCGGPENSWRCRNVNPRDFQPIRVDRRAHPLHCYTHRDTWAPRDAGCAGGSGARHRAPRQRNRQRWHPLLIVTNRTNETRIHLFICHHSFSTATNWLHVRTDRSVPHRSNSTLAVR